ncbi:MAG: DUF4956 domain-containing protein [Rubricoccaceae bacterium]|nr:DUF4956 domain-containing protein [Rubricoccaceae bacterium]
MTEFFRSPGFRLVSYFVLLAAALAAVWMLLPGVRPYVHISGVGGEALQQFDEVVGSPSAGVPVSDSLFQYGVLSMLAILATLLFTPPVAWVYMVTKRQEGYSQTFVQVLILLPIVVAGVVRVVQGDLALAFALAGIVAAVRFRTTLKDLKNAVFAFATIGIGLASGTGNWMVAGFLSLFFCLVTYGLWVRDIGGVKEMLSPTPKPMRLAEALVPGETQRSVVAGSRDYAKNLTSDELESMTPYAMRLAHFVRGDALKSKKKFDTLLILYTDDLEKATEKLQGPLEEFSDRHDLVDTIPGPKQSLAMIYLVRLKKEAELGGFLGALECNEQSLFKAAELKPIGGLRKQIT